MNNPSNERRPSTCRPVTCPARQRRRPQTFSIRKLVRRSKSDLHGGFTLVELLVTIVVLSILSAIAYPAFQELLNNNRTAGQARELGVLLAFARSEAIRQNADVGVLLTTTGAEVCNDLYADIDSVCAPNLLLRRIQFDRVALSRSAALAFTNRGYINPFDSAQEFDLTHQPCRGPGQSRHFRIERTGQLTITRPGCP